MRLYHGEGLALEALAALYRVHLSTVSRWLTCAREQIAEATLRHLRERLGVGPSEAESIAGLVLKQLDVSLLRYLHDAR
jgi:RNA polymerase sigma-70 factor (ECF subfamily)